MSNWTNLIKKISEEAREAASPATTTIGTVETVNPLSIKVDQKHTITAAFLIVPEQLTDYQTEISFDDSSIIQDYVSRQKVPQGSWSTTQEMRLTKKVKHKITVYNALKVGDEVIMVSKNGGQRYTVIDRLYRAQS